MRRVRTLARQLGGAKRAISGQSEGYFSARATAQRLRQQLDGAQKGKVGVVVYPALSDNYGFVVVTPKLEAAAVDTPDAEALFNVLDGLREEGIDLNLMAILNTHGHPGKYELQKRT